MPSGGPCHTIMRLIRKVDRRGRECVPFVRCLTGLKCIIIVRSREKRKGDMGGRSSLNFACNKKTRTVLRSVQAIGEGVRTCCPRLPLVLVKRDVNSLTIETFITRRSDYMSVLVIYNSPDCGATVPLKITVTGARGTIFKPEREDGLVRAVSFNTKTVGFQGSGEYAT